MSIEELVLERAKKLIRICQECKNEYIINLPKQKFCSNSCRKKSHIKSKNQIKGRDLFAA
jgi:hypothetical protein